MWALFTNRANKVLGSFLLSEGGVTGTVLDARIIFQGAILCNATGIILAHNHPSGNLRPSQSDLDMTKKIKEAGKLFDISLLDHIILTDEKYYSMADEGNL